MQTRKSKRNYLVDAREIAQVYWRSEEMWFAWDLLVAILLLNLSKSRSSPAIKRTTARPGWRQLFVSAEQGKAELCSESVRHLR